ncbi:MAG: DUF2061 domain-containing protein [Phycisphaerae bacterium]
MESHLRAITKAVSYRIWGSLTTFLITLAISKELKLAIGIGIIDPFVKIFLFYAHERIWNKIKFGRVKTPEYQI